MTSALCKIVHLSVFPSLLGRNIPLSTLYLKTSICILSSIWETKLQTHTKYQVQVHAKFLDAFEYSRKAPNTFVTSIRHSFYTSILLSLNPSIRQSVTPSIRQSVTPSNRQSVTPSIRQSVTPSIRQSVTPIRTYQLSRPGTHFLEIWCGTLSLKPVEKHEIWLKSNQKYTGHLTWNFSTLYFRWRH